MRVTRRTSSPQAVKAQFDYLTRGGRLPGELANGQTVTGRDDLAALSARWVAANRALTVQPSCPSQSVGVVLSMPVGTPIDAVNAAAREWAHEHLSPRTAWLAVPHQDKPHPHVHFAVRAVQWDGYRIQTGPDVMQAWRETFARNIQDRGIEALATPQREKLARQLDERPREHERAHAMPSLARA